MDEFDRPLFKILAHNDTGQAVGHQGGIVIPADLDEFFPQLSRSVTALSPTVDQTVSAELFDGESYLGTVETRYQIQTWGGTRSPERRLTGNLGALRNLARGGDLLLVQRHLLDDRCYRLRLFRQESESFQILRPSLGSRRWGPLDQEMPPAKETEIEAQLEVINLAESAQFQLFEADALLNVTRSVRVARSSAFQRRVVEIYNRQCAVCGAGFVHPDGRCENEAAHIVPRALRGADDARNGLLLCKSHHWAFDRGLFGISGDLRIIVSQTVASMPPNRTLASYHDKVILLPNVTNLKPHSAALGWHRNTVLIV